MSGIPEIKSEYSQTYKRIYAAGFVGGIIPSGLEAMVYSEMRDVLKVIETQPLSGNRTTIKRTIECALMLDPMQMKSLQQWLQQKISEYEKLFGVIPSPEEVESRSKRNSGQTGT
jgi:hypothetical protein